MVSRARSRDQHQLGLLVRALGTLLISLGAAIALSIAPYSEEMDPSLRL